MLLVWARAVLFAYLNRLPMIAPAWGKVMIGPYLRGERDKRFYGHLFSNKNDISRFKYILFSYKKTYFHYNPSISKMELSSLEAKVDYYIFIFNQCPHWSDYFLDLKEYQPIIKQKLFESIRSSVLEKIAERPVPEIGIHVRMGDFRSIKPEDDFTKLGSIRTPISWFIKVIESIRRAVGYDIPVTIFSDGHQHELKDLLQLPRVSRAIGASALSDMLTLSKSKLLITSSGSTFSYWASYLGQCPTIYHPAHFHAGVFSHNISQSVFEGGFDPESMVVPDLLTHNIKLAFHNS